MYRICRTPLPTSPGLSCKPKLCDVVLKCYTYYIVQQYAIYVYICIEQFLRSLVAEVLGERPGGMSVEGVDCVRLTLFKGQSTPFFTLNKVRYPEYST